MNNNLICFDQTTTRMLRSTTKLVTLLAACLSTLCGTTLAHGSQSTEEVYNSMMQTAEKISQHPQVRHDTFGSHLISCNSCIGAHAILKSWTNNILNFEEGHSFLNSKMNKARFHFFCWFKYSGSTCVRLIETYSDLVAGYLWTGVFSEEFFCGPIMNACFDHTF